MKQIKKEKRPSLFIHFTVYTTDTMVSLDDDDAITKSFERNFPSALLFFCIHFCYFLSSVNDTVCANILGCPCRHRSDIAYNVNVCVCICRTKLMDKVINTKWVKKRKIDRWLNESESFTVCVLSNTRTVTDTHLVLCTIYINKMSLCISSLLTVAAVEKWSVGCAWLVD